METVLITGGNSGLGFETAKIFLVNNYKVIVTCRDELKAKETVSKLKQFGNDIDAIVVELNNLEQIRRCVQKIDFPIEVLICNAGMVYSNLPIHYSKDGIEETFAVNHLANFYFATLLLSKNSFLKKILIVSSNLHSSQLSKGFSVEPNINNLDLVAYPERNGKVVDKKLLSVFYPNSKLCNILFGYEVNRRYPQIICNIISPGFMPGTGLPRYNYPLIRWALKNIFPLLGKFIKGIRTPAQSSSAIFKIVSSSLEGGQYYDGTKIIQSSELSHDTKLASKLWTYSDKIISEKVNQKN